MELQRNPRYRCGTFLVTTTVIDTGGVSSAPVLRAAAAGSTRVGGGSVGLRRPRFTEQGFDAVDHRRNDLLVTHGAPSASACVPLERLAAVSLELLHCPEGGR